MTRPAAIRVSDVRRLAKAAKLEGVTVRVVLPTGVVVEIDVDRESDARKPKRASGANEWDEVCG